MVMVFDGQCYFNAVYAFVLYRSITQRMGYDINTDDYLFGIFTVCFYIRNSLKMEELVSFLQNNIGEEFSSTRKYLMEQ